MSQVCYFTCTLVPPALVERAGFASRALLNGSPHDDPETTVRGFEPTILPHANTCPYVVNTLAAGERTLSSDADAVLVVPSGCDAMRRAGDVLRALAPERVFTYMVPRSDTPESVRALARELERLEEWLQRVRQEGDTATAEGSGPDGAPAPRPHDHGTFEYPRPPRPGGVFVLGGPMSGAGLLEVVERLGAPVSGVETCRGPECAARLNVLGAPGLGLVEVAREILSRPTCPRASSASRREFLRRRLDESGARAVIYARLPFCDPGAYDADLVQTLAAEMDLPFLEIEIDHPLDVDGRLLVRVEAFVETLTMSADLLDDDDLFEETSLAAAPESPVGATAAAPTEARTPPRGNGGDANRLVAGSFARRALAAKTRVAAFKSGTARRHLEHCALSASLDLYRPGAFVPWVSYLFPPEILASYGLTPLIPEVAATTLAGTDFADELEEAMNRQHLARDVCSYHRAAKAALRSGLLPAPSVCLGTTPLCLGKECMLDAIAAEHDVPFRSVRVPLPPDGGAAPQDAVDEVADQLRALHAYLGELTGRRPRLDKAIVNSNRASEAWRDICAKRLSGELILDGRRAFAFTFLGQVVWGSEEGAKGFERLRTSRGRSDLVIGPAGASDRTGAPDRGSGNGGPRARILWMHTMPHHDHTLFDVITAAGGAVVFEEMAEVHLTPLDPDDPFPGMARRLIEHPLWGSGVRRAKNALDVVERGLIDGVIHFNHWGCRHGLGTLPILRDTLRRAGVPFLALDGDALDPPGVGAESAVNQLESFLEML